MADAWADDAIVLGTVDYGDADRLVTLLTRGRGRVTAFAAGARKSKRRFAGALEPGTWLQTRFGRRKGELERLEGVDVQQTFHRLRDELPLIARALYALELCRELTREHEPNEALFEALKRYLARLDAKAADATSLVAFELAALELAGFKPRFDACTVCGARPDERVRFDPALGGIVGAECRARAPDGVPLPLEVVVALSGVQHDAVETLSPGVRALARGVLNAFIAHQLGRRLKSVDFLTQVGVD